MLVMARREVGLSGRIAARQDLIHVVPLPVRRDGPVLLRSWCRTDIDEDLTMLREVDVFDRSKDTILEDGVQASHGILPFLKNSLPAPNSSMSRS
jgi:hypothetical protein